MILVIHEQVFVDDEGYLVWIPPVARKEVAA